MSKKRELTRVKLKCFSSFSTGMTKEALSWLKSVNTMENANKYKALQLTFHSPVTVLSGCLMSLNDVNGKEKRYKNAGILKETFLLKSLQGFQQGKSVYRNGISVLLRITSEDIPRHLSTMHERLITRLQSNQHQAEKTTQWLSVILQRIRLNLAKGGSTSMSQTTVKMKRNFFQGDCKMNSS